MIFEHTFSLGTAHHASLHVQDTVIPDSSTLILCIHIHKY